MMSVFPKNNKPSDKIKRILEQWKLDESISQNITLFHKEPPSKGVFAPYPADLSEELCSLLQSVGIMNLYSHQVDAWNAACSGKNIVVTTGTSSGKTLSYNLPILFYYLKNSNHNFLYLFPTKALAQDQEKSLTTLFTALQNRINPAKLLGIYDGDTPQVRKKGIRDKANFVLTNPDMLHVGILPYHTSWARFFKNLRYIVIDEIHTYRGVFGSHVANIIRRMKRIANFYGSNPQFLMTSATIANPKNFAEKLVEAPVDVIGDDGSPRSGRTFILYNPPIIQQELGLREHPSTETIRLCRNLLDYDIQSLIFTRSRRSVELMYKHLQLILPGREAEISPYRSGYLPRERRAIEKRIREGIARIIISTNALELGIDIGSLDAILMVGYPGTTTAFKQQAGRAGRKNKEALIVLLASSYPLDQFLLKNPDYLFSQPVENALINPDNLLILLHHLRCAIYELPFSSEERFGAVEPETIEVMLDALFLAENVHQANNKFYWISENFPAGEVSLRTTGNRNFVLQTQTDDRATTIGVVDESSAYWMVHPGAIYLHAGQMYLVEKMDLQEEIVTLQPGDFEFFTEPKQNTTIEKRHIFRQVKTNYGEKFYGEIMVRAQVTGYRKIDWLTRDTIDISPLDMPETQLLTTSTWLSIGDKIIEDLREKRLWDNDRNYYGANWQQQRMLALERDKFTCQVCGRKAEKGNIHVHHREPFRNFTNHLEANRLNNLVCLCSSCHQRAETMVKVRSGLAGISYVFHHIASLILMCDYNDLGVLTDASSAMIEGKPGLLIYDQIPGGIGLSETIFNHLDLLIQNALDHISHCECSEGCPSCVGAPAEHGTGAKLSSLALLNALKYSNEQ